MKAETYNGWTNYETWNVKLWMDNDSGSYDYYMDLAKHNDDSYTLAQMLKEEHEENMPIVTGVYADLLQSALDNVNWHEIADSLLEDVKEELEEV